MNGDFRVLNLDHVALRLPAPEEAVDFYQRVLGLQETDRDPVSGAISLSVLPRDAAVIPHHDIVVYAGGHAEIDHIAFAVSDTVDLGMVANTLSKRGIEAKGPDEFESMDGAAVRMSDPDGFIIELLVPRSPVPRPPTDPGFDLVKIGHVTQKSPVPDKQRVWWEQSLGFRLSDQTDESFFFMRCNRDQHSMAFVRSESPRNHHIALELSGREEIIRFADHMASNGAQIEYGPGRHGPGNVLFVYLLDPWGFRWELFCDSIRIDDEENYQPGRWQGGRLSTVNVWGPKPPESFLS